MTIRGRIVLFKSWISRQKAQRTTQALCDKTMSRFWIRMIASLPLAHATVLLDGGRAKTKRGFVQFALLSALSDLAFANGIDTACIHARRTSIGFSLSIVGFPRTLHQRVRNIWGAYSK